MITPFLVPIKRFDPDLPLPSRESPGAACHDLYSREDVTIEPGTVGYIPLNIAIQLPVGHWALLAARSSTHKQGLLPANGVGIVDEDFKGDNDEYRFPLFNFLSTPVTVKRGARIAQMMILPSLPFTFEEVERLENTDRGGFGTTGI